MNWKFWQADSGSDRPPKPDVEEREEIKEWTVFEAIVHYRNGDTESFECYSKHSGDTTVKFATDIDYYISGYRNAIRTNQTYRKENYETLAREPTLEELRTEEYRLEYTVDYEWSNDGWSHNPYKWRESYEDGSLEVTQL